MERSFDQARSTVLVARGSAAQGTKMFKAEQKTWYHSNRYTAESRCQHCNGIIRHERWCLTQNRVVMQAYEAVLDAAKLSLADHLILHALGVCWVQPAAKQDVKPIC